MLFNNEIRFQFVVSGRVYVEIRVRFRCEYKLEIDINEL